MATPQHIAEASSTFSLEVGRRLAGDDACQGAKFHSPSPLVLQEVDLVPWSPTVSEIVLLCGTCVDNLSVLQDLLAVNEGVLSWAVRREFGNLIRGLGMRGWTIYSGSMGGGSDL